MCVKLKEVFLSSVCHVILCIYCTAFFVLFRKLSVPLVILVTKFKRILIVKEK